MDRPESQVSSGTSAPEVLSVTALNQAVGRMLERNFPLSWVAGEISNFTRAASGHWYFTLKDAGAQVRAVMFRGRAQHAGFTPREGEKVEVRALVTLYAPRGDYQLSVEAIRRAGLGNLYEAFLRMKQKLSDEGLFDVERKRPLPTFPRRVGIVTSLAAAALRDVLTALRRRAPHVEVVLYPTPVQGEGAAQRIADAIALASRRAECDVLLVARGGGSIEDLWSFNEEVVARAIVACSMPVISGVGHETDFTIADFAADLRAPTPTAAAEVAVRAREEWMQAVEARARTMLRESRRHLRERIQSLDWASRRLQSPSRGLAERKSQLAHLQSRLKHAALGPASQARFALLTLKGRLQKAVRAPVSTAGLRLLNLETRLRARLPDATVQRTHLGRQARAMQACFEAQLRHRRLRLEGVARHLEMLNPQRTLERGYAILTDGRGQVLRSPQQLRAREAIDVRLAEGSAQIGIASVQPRLE